MGGGGGGVTNLAKSHVISMLFSSSERSCLPQNEPVNMEHDRGS